MFCKMYRSKEKGFTLVELLVVIGIIGILALLLLPQFRGMRDRARVASCQSNLKNLGTQLEAEFVDRDRYPDGTRYGELTAEGAQLERLAKCPIGPTPYTYVPDVLVTTAPDSDVIDELASTIDATEGTAYLAYCTVHDGSGTASPANYPEVVQLYVTPEGVVRKQSYFP